MCRAGTAAAGYQSSVQRKAIETDPTVQFYQLVFTLNTEGTLLHLYTVPMQCSFGWGTLAFFVLLICIQFHAKGNYFQPYENV